MRKLLDSKFPSRRLPHELPHMPNLVATFSVKFYLDIFTALSIMSEKSLYREVFKMLKQYEAIYKNGQLQWIYPPPVAIENRRVMVSLADEEDEPKAINITKLLSQTRGSLGRRITREEIDRDVSDMRDEWTRKWDLP